MDLIQSKHSWAMRYASLGYSVFPLTPGQKYPLKGTNGFKDATTDLVKIEQWWTTHPNANIGVATGAVSGLWVIDIDVKNGKDGEAALKAFTPQGGIGIETMQAKTASCGRHIYLKWDAAHPVKSRANVLTGVDIRGDGGYVVAPPSVTEVGNYSWLPGVELHIADAPQWAIDLALTDQTSPTGKVVDRKHKVDPSKKLPWDLRLQIVGDWGMPINQTEVGRKYPCLCPFHDDKSPSAFFYRDRLTVGHLYCSACDKTWFTEKRFISEAELDDVHAHLEEACNA